MLDIKSFESQPKIPDLEKFKKWLLSWERGETTIKNPSLKEVQAVKNKTAKWGQAWDEKQFNEFHEMVLKTGGHPDDFYKAV